MAVKINVSGKSPVSNKSQVCNKNTRLKSIKSQAEWVCFGGMLKGREPERRPLGKHSIGVMPPPQKGSCCQQSSLHQYQISTIAINPVLKLRIEHTPLNMELCFSDMESLLQALAVPRLTWSSANWEGGREMWYACNLFPYQAVTPEIHELIGEERVYMGVIFW